ncbi:MAG: ABC transporter permease [Cyclobacteriaceae bacterium]|nr:ABC transporter permease [Cyclobacteriaceae bacterium]
MREIAQSSMKDNDEFVINPPGKLSLGLSEIWQYRELFYFFTWRDVKVKYKQTVLGIFWAVLQPLFMMLIFTLFFSRGMGIQSTGLPYPLFVFSGLILWNLFSNGITNAGNSMVTNSNIIKKIYFPRLIIPISSILSSLVDLCFAFIVFIGMLFWYSPSIDISSAILFWPLGILFSCIATFGPGCWLAALNIKYRDFRYVIPFLVQALLFLSPVIYPQMMVKQKWIEILLALNPMYAAIEIFRAPFNGGMMNTEMVTISIVSGVIMLLTGILYFKRTEMYFADLS